MTSTNAKLLDASQAAELCGVSRRSLLRWDADGTLGPRSIKLGHLRRWRRDQLEQWIRWNCPKRRTYRELAKGGTYGSAAHGSKSAIEAA